MKQLLFTILIVILGIPLLAQEIQFPPTVLASGGSSSDNNATNISISRWRLGQVHQITLPVNISSNDDLILDGLITLYPNPVEDFLNIEFQMEESKDYIIRLTDVLGRSMMIRDQRTILPAQVVELNLSEFIPAMYLLHIESPDRKTRIVFRIQKI